MEKDAGQRREVPARPRGAAQGLYGSSRPVPREGAGRGPHPGKGRLGASISRYLLSSSVCRPVSSAWHSGPAEFPGAELWKLFHYGFHAGPLPS